MSVAFQEEPRPLAELESDLVALASDLAAAECRFLQLLAEFDRREGWAGWGVVSCAHWLAWRCQMSAGAAREKVRVARALDRLPLVTAAFSAGRLSYSGARSISRVADSKDEAALVELAEHATTAQLEKVVRSYRVASAAEVGERELRRKLTWQWNEDGSLAINGRLDPAEGAAFIAAMEAGQALEPLTPGVPPDRAATLVTMAEAYVARRSGNAQAGGADVYQVVVHVQAGDRPSVPAILEDGPALAPETAMRLACDAAIYCVHEDRDGSVLDVGRRTRSIPAALRRALRRRDGGCRFPGCSHRRRVDGHHVEHWSNGGATSLENLVLLCRRHHTLVHEGGFTVVMAQGRRGPGWQPVFSRPDGVEVPEQPARPAADQAPEAIRRAHLQVVQPGAVASRWMGDRLDMDCTLSALFSRRRRAERDQPDQDQDSPEPDQPETVTED